MGRPQGQENPVKCEVRGRGERSDQRIRYSLSLDDKLLVVENVPAIVCDRRGEITLSPAVTERLQQTAWESRRPARVVETEVYEFV